MGRKQSDGIRVGGRYGRLVVEELVISLTGKGVRRTMATCLCDCGVRKTIRADGLSHTRSCGCLDREQKRQMCVERNKRNAKLARHGRFSCKYPTTFSSWRSMLNRCYNTKQRAYATYGATGVIVCEGLRASPWNLIDLIGPRKKAKPSLDRHPIHDGNYTCGRCDECRREGWGLNIRWTTRKEQSLNRGGFNMNLTAFGKTMAASQWGELTGMDAETIRGRIRKGWPVERALTTPDKQGRCYRP